jgi:hypothetical protein
MNGTKGELEPHKAKLVAERAITYKIKNSGTKSDNESMYKLLRWYYAFEMKNFNKALEYALR